MASSKQRAQSTDLVHIYSTLANPQTFIVYRNGGADLPVPELKVTIAGGAGIATKNLITPLGTHTSVPREDYERIKDLKHFKSFVDRGFIVVQDRKASDIEAVVGDMQTNDPSAPYTPTDIEKEDAQLLDNVKKAA